MAAARCRLDSVMSSFALRSRSTCVRLVFSSEVILFFDFFFFIASASCCLGDSREVSRVQSFADRFTERTTEMRTPPGTLRPRARQRPRFIKTPFPLVRWFLIQEAQESCDSICELLNESLNMLGCNAVRESYWYAYANFTFIP